MDYFDLGDQYSNIIMIEEYEGKVSLVMGQLGKDGQAYKRWGKLDIGTKAEPKYTKNMPWKVTLGTKEQAIEALEFFLLQLGIAATVDDGGDIPF